MAPVQRKLTPSRSAVIALFEMLRGPRMAAIRKLHCGVEGSDERPVRAVLAKPDTPDHAGAALHPRSAESPLYVPAAVRK